MIPQFLIYFLALLSFPLAAEKQDIAQLSLKTGDLIFTSSRGVQADAVKAATDSPWTHVALIFIEKDKPMVLEAVQPVQIITLDAYLKRGGKDRIHQVKRLKDRSKITPESIKKATLWASKHISNDYDGRFLWSDTHLYCSELVWKIFHQAMNIELCKVNLIKDYNLMHPKVQALIKMRYRSMKNLNLNEKVVAPSDLYKSELLEEL